MPSDALFTRHSDAFDTEAILECLLALKRGEPVEIPVYDFKTHQRSTETRKVCQGNLTCTRGTAPDLIW